MKVTCSSCNGSGLYANGADFTDLVCKSCNGHGTITVEPTGTESRVCADIAARQAKGFAKYGTTVEANPLSRREWVQHAYEECLDMAVYLRRFMEEMDKSPFDKFFDAAEKTDAYKKEMKFLKDAREFDKERD